jgi:drug/metabolite transporter (DMT)-like permease
MRSADAGRLVALAAIWGASFIFIRLLSPVLGPVVTALSRVLIAGVALIAYFRATGFDGELGRFWRQYLVIGLVNSALPFLLFAFAALWLPASYLAILNAAAPSFGVLLSAAVLGEALTVPRIAGLVAGAAGVTLIAGWSQIFAAAALLPAVPFSPVRGAITAAVAGDVLALALLCSAIAYLLYYRLIADVGPSRALTVTFLIPLFGMLWGALLLGETITPAMIAGCALIVGGTVAVLRPAAS